MKHEVKIEDIEGWVVEHQAVASTGKGSAKELKIQASESGHYYEVIDHGERVYLGKHLGHAVEAYNKAP